MKLLTLTSQVRYLKPLTNSFRPNIPIRNSTSSIDNMEVELSGAEQTASTEANAASAVNNDDKEVIMAVKEDSDTSEVDEELFNYNE